MNDLSTETRGLLASLAPSHDPPPDVAQRVHAAVSLRWSPKAVAHITPPVAAAQRPRVSTGRTRIAQARAVRVVARAANVRAKGRVAGLMGREFRTVAGGEGARWPCRDAR